MHFCHMYLIQQKDVIKTKELYLKKIRLIFQKSITGGKIYLNQLVCYNLARLDFSWTQGQLKNLRFGWLNFILISQKNSNSSCNISKICGELVQKGCVSENISLSFF